MEELKQEATELGLDFKGNISKAELQAMVDTVKQNTDSKENLDKARRIKVIVSSREDGETFGRITVQRYTARFQFGEEIELPYFVIESMKECGSYKYDKQGNKKWQSRWIIEKI